MLSVRTCPCCHLGQGETLWALSDHPPVTVPGVRRTLASLFSHAALSLERSHLRVVTLRQ